MPGGNGTGPLGMGPMTGRAAGYCAANGVPGCMNLAFGRGAGMGCGRGFGGGGRGRRNRFYATGLTGWQRAAGGVVPPTAFMPTAEQQLAVLKSQAEAAENELGELRRRMAEIEAKPEVK